MTRFAPSLQRSQVSRSSQAWRAACVAGTVALLSMAGCNRGPDIGHVTGIVTLDGKALPGATVTFEPTAGNHTSQGITDELGHYELDFAPGGKGALPGQHRVVIETGRVAVQEDGTAVNVPEILPAKYHHDTELLKDVTAGENKIDFELTSK